jgi:hypothetical protein
MKERTLVAAAFILAVVGADAASASTTFTYTPATASDTVQAFSFTSSLDGAAISNLIANTDITASIAPFTFNFDHAPFAVDKLGFPVGGAFGSAYFNTVGNATVTIGTNALGQINSWDIFEDIFVSWPAVPNEDPNDFFGTYRIHTTNTGNTIVLTQDRDAGLAPTPRGLGLGSFSATTTASVPEPATWAMMFLGFGAIGWAMRRQRQRQLKVRFAF